MKETFYFSHDYHARTDEKIIELLLVEKWEGYWLFWAIVEKLYENEWYIDQKYERIAYDLRTNNERIQSVVENYWLFIFDWKRITSKSVLERLRQRKDKSKKAQQSVKARWDKEKKGDTNVIRDEYERNTIKERKGKERKIKEIDTNTEIVSSETKNPNEEFFDKLQNDTDWFIDTMNISEEQRETARRELFKFWNYWTEKDLRWKEKWQKEKTFEAPRRLTTWLMNAKFTSNQSQYEKKWRITG